jgi:hypothetical protein
MIMGRGRRTILGCKQVEKWEFRNADHKYYTCRLMIDGETYGKTLTLFGLMIMGDGREERINGDTPRAIYDAAESLAQSDFALDWTPMIYVMSDGGADLNDPHEYASVELKVMFYEVATLKRKDDGKRYTQHYYRAISDGEPCRTQRGRPDENYRGERKGALIPDTPENREALERLMNGLDAIAKQVNKLMSPKMIAATLTGQNKLLPG